MTRALGRVRCREIVVSDIDCVITMLTRGFDRSPAYWRRAFDRLTQHPTPPGLPKYGYVLAADDRLVGVLLLIATTVTLRGEPHIRCNVTSWYVEPAYRGYAALLAMYATRHKNVTYFNVSPAPHTWPILEAKKFERFAEGRTIAMPLFNRRVPHAQVAIASADSDLPQGEIDVLLQHQTYGCLSLICTVADQRYPFVFGLNRRRFYTVAHLIYCRDLSEFIHFAGPLGRFLARRGFLVVKFHSNGPLTGIVGRHFGGHPKFRKGSAQIHLGDVAYSEQVMFGY